MSNDNTDLSDKHHRQWMNKHLRAAIERALQMSNPDLRVAALERIIKEADKAKNDPCITQSA